LAAFGSYNPKEVDDLRDALVECMRNTPLNNGIRATGAVQDRPSEPEPRRQIAGGESSDRYRASSASDVLAPRDRSDNETPSESNDGTQRTRPQSLVATSVDLLGDTNPWDDPSHSSMPDPVTQQHQQQKLVNAGQPAQFVGTPQHSYSGSIPHHQGVQQGAIVPVTSVNQPYPGAPPPPTMQYAPQSASQHYGQPQVQQYDGMNTHLNGVANSPQPQHNNLTSPQTGQQQYPGHAPVQQQTYSQQQTYY